MTTSKFVVSPAAQRDYRVVGGAAPSGAQKAAKQAFEKAKAARQPDAIHVTKRDDGWAIKTAGNERASSVKPTKAQALSTARAFASKRGARVVEHGQDGKILRNSKPRAR